MSNAAVSKRAALPRGVVASMVIGIAAAACSWLASGIAPLLIVSNARLDQVDALLSGAIAGAAVLAARAFRRREAITFSGAAGALLGGVGALCGASLLAFLRTPASPHAFLVERVLAWACTCGGSTLLLGAFVNRGGLSNRTMECALLGCGGGAIAGVLFALPGASDVWQAAAMLWLGATIGFAVAGPELWHAPATVELLPGKGVGPSLVILREWPLQEGMTLVLGEAQVACVGGRIALYPPAGGVVWSGRSVRRPLFLVSSGTVAVGRARYQIRITGEP